MVKEKNVYKIITFVLLGIILVSGLIFGGNLVLGSAYDSGVVYGEQSAVEYMISEISDKGFVQVNFPNNQSVKLVSSNSIVVGQEEVILEILKTVSDDGYVQLNYGDNESLILVPYVPEVSKN